MTNNLPESAKWKKGQSGNPNGRPKGSRSFSTLLREFMEKPIPNDQEAVIRLKQMFPHYFNGNEKTDAYTITVLRLISGVLSRDGNEALKYIKEIADRTEGRSVQKIQHQGDSEKPLEINFSAGKNIDHHDKEKHQDL